MSPEAIARQLVGDRSRLHGSEGLTLTRGQLGGLLDALDAERRRRQVAETKLRHALRQLDAGRALDG